MQATCSFETSTDFRRTTALHPRRRRTLSLQAAVSVPIHWQYDYYVTGFLRVRAATVAMRLLYKQTSTIERPFSVGSVPRGYLQDNWSNPVVSGRQSPSEYQTLVIEVTTSTIVIKPITKQNGVCSGITRHSTICWDITPCSSACHLLSHWYLTWFP
jgi:hypothetical protein